MRKLPAVYLALVLGACSNEPATSDDIEVPGYGSLEYQVQEGKVGMSSDHWIEMKNFAGEWERTGLIFGYSDDYAECLKAIGGLKEVNYEREYRCVPAND